MANSIHPTGAGLFCSDGGFHIDPWKPVERAVITHAHRDHLVAGCGTYYTSSAGLPLVRLRLGNDATVEELGHDQPRRFGGTQVSLHPAGHIRGAAQVCIRDADQVTVVTGDFKTDADPTCESFQPLACDVLVTESTFGLPIFRWPHPRSVIAEIEDWWRTNQQAGKASVVFAYAMGKAQRVLASLSGDLGPIYTHGAVEKVCAVYRKDGVALPETELATKVARKTDWSSALIVAPPSAMGTPWVKRFGRISTAMVSGWMRVRGIRRRRSIDRGFVLSDHVDWPGLLDVIESSGASKVLATHGYTGVLSRHLQKQGWDASALETRFQGEQGSGEPGGEEE